MKSKNCQIKIGAGRGNRTLSIPTWKDGAPPIMRYLLLNNRTDGEIRTHTIWDLNPAPPSSWATSAFCV